MICVPLIFLPLVVHLAPHSLNSDLLANEEDLKNEGNLKNKDNLINVDNLKK